MANTRPNLRIHPDLTYNLFVLLNIQSSQTGQPIIAPGTSIRVEAMSGTNARIHVGPTMPYPVDDACGYTELTPYRPYTSKAGDQNIFIWSAAGCTINVSVA